MCRDVVAALFVAPGGVYYGLPNVEPWGLPGKDARLYAGPHRVIAHPPCARWGRLWYRGGKAKGDDDGCFAAALESVRMWGGVLEHPGDTSAWKAFRLNKPPRGGGWVAAGDHLGMTCEVEQGHYGHRSRKRTWLYAVRCQPLDLVWGPSKPLPSVNSVPQAPRAGRPGYQTGIVQRMSKRQRLATPPAFRDALISLTVPPLHTLCPSGPCPHFTPPR